MTRTESPPRPIDEHLPRIRETPERAEGLLVCLDFDGTLAPIVEDPDAAVPTEQNRSAVATLANTPSVTTAVVSGRALTDVRERVDGPAIYAGNHGLELVRTGTIAVHPIARKRAARLERICAILETALRTVPNCRIENKRLTGTVHFRSVPPARRTDRPPHHPRGGRAIRRRRPRDFGGETDPRDRTGVPVGKGNAVELIAADEPPATASIYIGDDVTDESAFQAVEPDGIRGPGCDEAPSSASCRVESPAEVASFLSWLGSTGADLVARSDVSTATPIEAR